MRWRPIMSFERSPDQIDLASLQEAPANRRLAALVSADVCGFSRLVEENEDRTRTSLYELRSTVEAVVAAHDGRIVDAVGDNMLAEFSSAVNAVAAAVSIQNSLATAPADDDMLQLRIGITIGDVVVSNGQIFGPGVNIAARVQGLAAPGGVAVAANVVEQVAHKLPIRFRRLGKFRLKNIGATVVVHSVAVDHVRSWRPGKPGFWTWPLMIGAAVGAGVVLVGLMMLAIHMHEVVDALTSGQSRQSQ